MKPPIASPHEEDRPIRPITKRVEWDDERECFVLRYRVSFWGRLRGSTYLASQSLIEILFFPIGFPIVAFSLVIAAIAQRYKRPSEFRVFAWGIEYGATEAAYRTEWKNIGETFVRKGSAFILLKPLLRGAYCLPHENFADEDETLRLQQILELLKSENGANWESVKSQFKP